MSDNTTQTSERIVEALQYAHDHDLDIHNKHDVQTILNTLDPEHTENIEEFAKLLDTSETFMDMQAQKIKSKNPLSN